nr:hypothetical protein [Tanacetum cinerariifolium]GFB35867.1 hypothetical protein [Tanacetum cinerariifolium]
MQEFRATAKLHHNSIRFKKDTGKSVLDLESFREMLHISRRIPSQSFAEFPFEEEILEFLRHLGHSDEIRHLTDVNPSIPRRNRINWHYVMDDVLFSTIKVVSRHQTTQQYDVILPIELTTDDIKNSKAYKEYYTCATGEATPKPKASARKKKGDSASSTTPPTPTPTTTVVAAPRLSATAKEEKLSWNSFDDEEVDEQTKGREESEGNKTDESDDGSDDGNDDDNDETVKAVSESEGESDEEETRQEEEESFDSIPRTPEGIEDEGSDEEDQELRFSEEARIQEEEE